MKRFYAICIVFNILFIALCIVSTPTYKASSLQEYVGVWAKTHSGSRHSPYTLIMTDGTELDVGKSISSYVFTDGFKEDVKNQKQLIIKYVHHWFTGRRTVVTLETKDKVYLSLDKWNAEAKKNLAFVIVFLAVVDGIVVWCTLPPDYVRMEKKKQKQRIKKKQQKEREVKIK